MRVLLKTMGCRLNQSESAEFAAVFLAAGCTLSPPGAECDVVLLHTCVVTGKAERECLRMIRAQRHTTPRALIAVSGCAVELVPHEKLRSAGADIIVPHHQKSESARILLREMGVALPVKHLPAPRRGQARALLRVQDGCDFFCSYCIVPHTRGAPRSVALEKCIEDATSFIEAGFEEVVVTGCNLACYRHGESDLPALVSALAALPGLGRLRLGSIEPGTVELEIARLMADSDKICHTLHLPVQSADDRTLARMKRSYTSSAITERVHEILRLVPGVALGSDIITGFPGETEEAFERTFEWVRSLPFANLHVFPYSERPGTPATELSHAVPHPVRKARARKLIRLGQELRARFAERFVGKSTEVLIERYDKQGIAYGWSREYLPCVIENTPRQFLRKLARCQVESRTGDTLRGFFI